MKKLTLSAKPEVVERAKRYAQEHGTTVSALFERFIRVLTTPQRGGDDRVSPTVRKVSGCVRLPRGKTAQQVLDDALLDRHGFGR